MTQPDERMVSRLTPPPGSSLAEGLPGPRGSGAEFLIVIPASDGTTLLRMFERNGRLAIEYPEDRVEEAAKRLLVEMARWSGVVGIRWKNEAVKLASE